MGQMVGGIAHELANPITGILGYAQTLRARHGSSEWEEVDQIYQEASRAARILRQLLERGRQGRPSRKPVSLNDVVLRALEYRRIGMPLDRIRLEVVLDPTNPVLTGDEDRLQQVIVNLVSNAQQAIELGHGTGTIRVVTSRTGDRSVRLEVEDDGPGIPPSLLNRIFDPYFTTKPAGLGTGLGLSIVLSIAREHGGRVQASNRSGGGAVFTVDFPARASRRADSFESTIHSVAAASPANLPPAPAQDRATAAARILVVEDEPTVARLISDVLRGQGHEVEALDTVREAQQRAESREYDLVICDLNLPEVDGRKFYELLSRSGHPLARHFLFVTGDALAAPALGFLRASGVPFVHKPFHVEELTQVGRQLLGRGAARLRKAAGRKTS